jgi:hypothetical protein
VSTKILILRRPGSGKINVIDNAALCDNDRSIGNDDDDDNDLHDDGVSLPPKFLIEKTFSRTLSFFDSANWTSKLT